MLQWLVVAGAQVLVTEVVICVCREAWCFSIWSQYEKDVDEGFDLSHGKGSVTSSWCGGVYLVPPLYTEACNWIFEFLQEFIAKSLS
jgi:hypothetical protein